MNSVNLLVVNTGALNWLVLGFAFRGGSVVKVQSLNHWDRSTKETNECKYFLWLFFFFFFTF